MNLKPLTNTLGPNATQVLRRITATIEPEPTLTQGFENLLSEQWVQWHMRSTGVPRVIALNRGFAKLEAKTFRIDHENYPYGMPVDKGLKVLGVTRPEDYFFHTRKALERVGRHH